MSITVGILLVLGLGSIPGFHYYHSALVMVGFVAVFTCLVLWVPESPRWLILKGDQKQAIAALHRLRGPKYPFIHQEVKDIKLTIPKLRPGFYQLMKELVMKRSTLVPFILLLFLGIFNRACGVDVFSAYAASIFLEAGVPNPNLTTTFAVGAVNVLATFVAVILVEFVGRKILLAVSAVGMFLGTTLLGVHFYITQPELCANSTLPVEQYVSCNLHTFPLAIVGVIVFNLGFSIGTGPVPWVLLSEYLPLRIRGVAGSVVVAANWATASLIVGTFLSLSEKLGPWTVWWTLAALNLVGFFVFVLFFVETKGKTLEEVQELFKTRKSIVSCACANGRNVIYNRY
jgi:SP family facilitated glucose transporter-like MFS transporter 8